MEETGKQIRCERCDGAGLVASWSFDGPIPDECPDCNGSGRNWQYPKGAIAKHYAGPLIGRAGGQ
jgi:DnaJ-class molecular chaperone